MKKPRIKLVSTTEAYVKIRREVPGSTEKKTTPKNLDKESQTKEVTATEEVETTSHEAPLPAFISALSDLADVVVNVMEYGAPYKKGLTPTGFAVKYTKSGTRSMQVSFFKAIDATGGIHPGKTPFFQMEDSKNPNEGRAQCAKKHVDTCKEAIKQAERYANGERSQTLLNFKEEDEDDGKQGELAGVEPIEGANAGE